MYIAFEGIEGSGKSVQLDNIADFLNKNRYSFILTKEPGSTTVGKEIRKILLNSKFSDLSILSEIFLYFADRAEHFNKIIKKNINKVDFIISDRSLFSTLAYQGFARGFDFDLLKMLNDIATDKIYPDFVLLFDCPVEVGLKRAIFREKNKKIDEARFEKESIEFHKKVREGYLNLANEYNNWFIIDASQSIDIIKTEVIKIFKKIIKENLC